MFEYRLLDEKSRVIHGAFRDTSKAKAVRLASEDANANHRQVCVEQTEIVEGRKWHPDDTRIVTLVFPQADGDNA